MTAVVGVICSDGVVIGTDSSATMGPRTNVPSIEHPIDKLHILDNKVIIAGTGSVGHGQRFEQIIKNQWEKLLFAHNKRLSAVEVCTKLSKYGIDDFLLTRSVGAYGTLVAFPHKSGPILCEFTVEDFQPELKVSDNICWCSMGSTQMITDPFLAFLGSILWSNRGQPTVRQAMLAVTWTLDHAIELNPGGVKEPVKMAVLKNGDLGYSAVFVTKDELEEHRGWIKEAKESMGNELLVALDKASVSPRLDE